MRPDRACGFLSRIGLSSSEPSCATTCYHRRIPPVGSGLVGAFEQLRRQGADAVVVVSDPLLHAQSRRIIELAERNRLPTVYERRLFTDVSGLLSYGPGRLDRFQRAAVYIDRILRAAKPAELPIERPTKFELVLSLKAARALGLTIPQAVLLQADDVIQ